MIRTRHGASRQHNNPGRGRRGEEEEEEEKGEGRKMGERLEKRGAARGKGDEEYCGVIFFWSLFLCLPFTRHPSIQKSRLL